MYTVIFKLLSLKYDFPYFVFLLGICVNPNRKFDENPSKQYYACIA